MHKAVLIGSNGQLGTEISRIWSSRPNLRGTELVCLTHADLDITDRQRVDTVLGEAAPDAVINTAGFLRVDECEKVPETAVNVNAIGTQHVADYCRKNAALLVHLSTDYVFDGCKHEPYCENDNAAPVNAYGLSKLMGECFVRYLLPDTHLIVRTSGLFGPAGSTNKGGNFIETMLRLAGTGKSLRVVDDQIFSPTYSPDLAEVLLDLVEADARGVFHVTNAGNTSWYEFARSSFDLAGMDADLTPATTAEYASPARRPAYSVLDNALAERYCSTKMPAWQDGLERYMLARKP
ncbi:MAG TPA: dTDP-4-dehydrorhamnose reductase [Dehalococcoidia bacterium]|nr:dTDP-4-dehydrorhamnose reductase [Dehalococcoidia bacterium]